MFEINRFNCFYGRKSIDNAFFYAYLRLSTFLGMVKNSKKLIAIRLKTCHMISLQNNKFFFFFSWVSNQPIHKIKISSSCLHCIWTYTSGLSTTINVKVLSQLRNSVYCESHQRDTALAYCKIECQNILWCPLLSSKEFFLYFFNPIW